VSFYCVDEILNAGCNMSIINYILYNTYWDIYKEVRLHTKQLEQKVNIFSS